MKPELEQMIEGERSKISDLNDQITADRENAAQIEESKRQIEAQRRRRKGAVSDSVYRLDELAEQLESYERGVARLTERRSRVLAEKIVTANTVNIVEEINSHKDALSEIEKEVVRVSYERGDLVEWEARFKKFKSHLANKAISTIQSYTSHYLQQMNTNLGVNMSGFKVKADGKLSEKISTTITRNGIEVGPFGRFSGGEKVRIEVCNIIALQQLINLNSESGGLDLLFLDEIIESVDGAGVTELMKALNLLEKTVLVITHTNHAGVYDHVVTVQKRGGSSNII